MKSQDPSKRLPSESGEHRTLQLLKKIQSGAINPSNIDKDSRRPLVAHLTGDGYSIAEMAEILKVSERTIERDRKAIRESNAIPRDPKMVEQVVGQLSSEADLCTQRIRKAVRGNDAPEHVKVEAEHRCFQIRSDLFQRLQGIGYLPTVSQRIEADLTHHAGDVPDVEVMRVEVRRIRQIVDRGGSDNGAGTELASKLVVLEQDIERASLAGRIQDAARTIETKEDDDEQQQ